MATCVFGNSEAVRVRVRVRIRIRVRIRVRVRVRVRVSDTRYLLQAVVEFFPLSDILGRGIGTHMHSYRYAYTHTHPYHLHIYILGGGYVLICTHAYTCGQVGEWLCEWASTPPRPFC